MGGEASSVYYIVGARLSWYRWKWKSFANSCVKSPRTSPPFLLARTSALTLLSLSHYTNLPTTHHPATMTTWATELFGPKLLTKPKTSGLPTESRFQGKKLVAIYFSASWWVLHTKMLMDMMSWTRKTHGWWRVISSLESIKTSCIIIKICNTNMPLGVRVTALYYHHMENEYWRT